MKFSKSSWILLVLGVVVIGAIMVGMVLSQQAQQQRDLEKQLIESQKKLAQIKIDDLTASKDQLTQDKELYTTQIADAKAKLAAPIDNISATDVILKSAHEFEIRIVNINSGGKSNNTLADNKFTALPFTVQVEGNIANIAGFVSNIKTLFPTSVVETYQFAIGIPTPTPDQPAETPVEAPEITPTPTPPPPLPIDTAATINIIIYDYKGDANVE